MAPTAAAATGAAAAIGTKAAAGIATAAILAGGAAEIKHVTTEPSQRPQAKERAAVQSREPSAQCIADLSRSRLPTEAAATSSATTPPQPTETVTVPPQPSEAATTGGTAASVLPLGNKRKHHGGDKHDRQHGFERLQRHPADGPGRHGRRPSSTCDTNGDGVADPGAPTTCTTGSTGAKQFGVDQTTTTPPAAVYSVPLKKQQPKSTSKQKSTGKSSTKWTQKKRAKRP